MELNIKINITFTGAEWKVQGWMRSFRDVHREKNPRRKLGMGIHDVEREGWIETTGNPVL